MNVNLPQSWWLWNESNIYANWRYIVASTSRPPTVTFIFQIRFFIIDVLTPSLSKRALGVRRRCSRVRKRGEVNKSFSRQFSSFIVDRVESHDDVNSHKAARCSCDEERTTCTTLYYNLLNSLITPLWGRIWETTPDATRREALMWNVFEKLKSKTRTAEALHNCQSQ